MNVGEESLTRAFTGFVLDTFAGSVGTTTSLRAVAVSAASSEFGKRKGITDFVIMCFYLLFSLFIMLPEPRLVAERSTGYIFKITSSETT
jgi:hypothetical protein